MARGEGQKNPRQEGRVAVVYLSESHAIFGNVFRHRSLVFWFFRFIAGHDRQPIKLTTACYVFLVSCPLKKTMNVRLAEKEHLFEQAFLLASNST